MIPDLPMPVRTTRPLHWRRSLIAQSNLPSSRSTSARIAAASVSRTLRASARSATKRHLARLDDRVDGDQPAEQRLQPVEPERVLRIALRARRLLMHLEEDAVDAGRHAGRGERLDELR